MSDRRWVRLVRLDSLPLREGRVVVVGGREVALFNLGDAVLAAESRCPHRGGPLADGIVSGTAVVCPLHAWKVDLKTGGVERPAATGGCIRTYEVRIEDGVVAIAWPRAAGGAEDCAA